MEIEHPLTLLEAPCPARSCPRAPNLGWWPAWPPWPTLSSWARTWARTFWGTKGLPWACRRDICNLTALRRSRHVA